MRQDELEEISIAIESDEASREFLLAKRNLSGSFTLKSIPAFAYGFGIDDEVEVVDTDVGIVRLIKRGNNITVRLFKLGTLNLEEVGRLVEQVSENRGVYEIARNARKRGESSLLLISYPLSYGLKNIEADMGAFSDPAYSWEFGNIYDEEGAPLNWWK